MKNNPLVTTIQIEAYITVWCTVTSLAGISKRLTLHYSVSRNTVQPCYSSSRALSGVHIWSNAMV